MNQVCEYALTNSISCLLFFTSFELSQNTFGGEMNPNILPRWVNYKQSCGAVKFQEKNIMNNYKNKLDTLNHFPNWFFIFMGASNT